MDFHLSVGIEYNAMILAATKENSVYIVRNKVIVVAFDSTRQTLLDCDTRWHQ